MGHIPHLPGRNPKISVWGAQMGETLPPLVSWSSASSFILYYKCKLAWRGLEVDLAFLGVVLAQYVSCLCQ